MSEEHLQPVDLLVETIRNRLGYPELPDSAIRGALLGALVKAGPPTHGYTVTPWLLKMLRLGAEETCRRLGLAIPENNQTGSGDTVITEAEPFHVAHACILGMMSEIDPDHASLMRQIELAHVNPTQLAVKLGTTPSSVKVRARRAREDFYERLMEACRTRRG